MSPKNRAPAPAIVCVVALIAVEVGRMYFNRKSD
jgi:hypothetical protein